jgi:hypothetical protein
MDKPKFHGGTITITNPQEIPNNFPRSINFEAPTLGELNNSDCGPDKIIRIQELHKSYLATANPVYAMEAFLLARGNNLYAPEWVHQWLSNAFQEYIESGGESDIAKLLGTNPGRGKTKPHTKRLQDENDYRLMAAIWRIKTAFSGVSVEDASFMVNQRETEQGRDIATAETLADKYYRSWSSDFDAYHEQCINIPSFVAHWTDEDNQEFLNTFPKHCIPSVLK